MKPNKGLYWILAILSTAGYAWIGFHLFFEPGPGSSFTICLFKNLTGLPCPSCGVTRSLLLLATGDIYAALMINPLGGLVAVLMVITPPWILMDTLTGKKTLAPLFLWTEKRIQSSKAVSLPLVALVLLNWGWNILKDL